MSQTIQNLVQAVRNSLLIRKKHLLEKVLFSKSTLHAKLNKDSPYFDETFPPPFYLPKSRTPLWRECDVDDWIARAERNSRIARPNEIQIARGEPGFVLKQAAQGLLGAAIFAAPQPELNGAALPQPPHQSESVESDVPQRRKFVMTRRGGPIYAKKPADTQSGR